MAAPVHAGRDTRAVGTRAVPCKQFVQNLQSRGLGRTQKDHRLCLSRGIGMWKPAGGKRAGLAPRLSLGFSTSTRERGYGAGPPGPRRLLRPQAGVRLPLCHIPPSSSLLCPDTQSGASSVTLEGQSTDLFVFGRDRTPGTAAARSPPGRASGHWHAPISFPNCRQNIGERKQHG